MLLRSLFVLLLPPIVAPSPFQHRGIESIASNWNLSSSISTLSAPARLPSTVQPLYPFSANGTAVSTHNGGSAHPTGKRPSPNDTCGGCIVNVPNANIDWWYAATFEFAVATLLTYKPSSFWNTTGPPLLTKVPVTEVFNVTESLNGYALTETSSWNSEWNSSWLYWEAYDVLPSAQSTTVVTRTDFIPFPTDGIIPFANATDYYTPPAPASIAITGASRTVFVATSATPFAYFSAYEVVSQIPISAANGQVRCETVTGTYSLPEPYAFSYEGKGLENQSVATADVPSAFLKQIPQASCRAGTYQGFVTVVVVVDLFYEIEHDTTPFIVHIESSVLGLEGITTAAGNEGPHAASKEHLESSITPAPALSQVVTVQGGSTGVASDWPGLFPIVKSFMSFFAHIEQSTSVTGLGNGEAQQTGPVTGLNGDLTTTEFVGTIGTDVVQIGPSSKIVIGSQTLVPGGSPITVGGVPLSLATSANVIVVGGQTLAAPALAQTTAIAHPAPPPVITIGISTLTANAATQFLVAPSQVLTPGGEVTVSGTVISLGPSASFVVVGGSTQVLSTAAPAAVTDVPVIVVGGTTLTANSGSSFVVSGSTLAPGSAITLSGGTTLSLDAGATNVVIDGETQPVILQSVTAAPVLTVGSQTLTAVSGSTFIISGQTLSPGGTITVNGETIALGQSASYAIINGVTQTLSNAAAQITPPPLSIGNGVYSVLLGGGTTYMIGGSSLTPGGTITVAGSTIVLSPGATALIVDGVTTNLVPTATITNPPLLTIGQATYTALPGTGTTFVIDGQTLTPGAIITVSGTTISLSPSATALVFGSGSSRTTETLFPATTTRNPSATTTNASAGASLTAGAAKASSTHGAASHVHSSPSSAFYLLLTLALRAVLV